MLQVEEANRTNVDTTKNNSNWSALHITRSSNQDQLRCNEEKLRMINRLHTYIILKQIGP